MDSLTYAQQLRAGLLASRQEIDDAAAKAVAGNNKDLVTKSHTQEQLAIQTEAQNEASALYARSLVVDGHAHNTSLNGNALATLSGYAADDAKDVTSKVATAASNVKSTFDALQTLNATISGYHGNSAVQATDGSRLGAHAKHASDATSAAFLDANQLASQSMKTNVIAAQPIAAEVSQAATEVETDLATILSATDAILKEDSKQLELLRKSSAKDATNASKASVAFGKSNDDELSLLRTLQFLNHSLNGDLTAALWSPSTPPKDKTKASGTESPVFQEGLQVSVTPPAKIFVPSLGSSPTAPEGMAAVKSVTFVAVRRTLASIFDYAAFSQAQEKGNTQTDAQPDTAGTYRTCLTKDAFGQPVEVGEVYSVLALYSPDTTPLPKDEGLSTLLSLPSPPVTYQSSLLFTSASKNEAPTPAPKAAPGVTTDGDVLTVKFDYVAYATDEFYPWKKGQKSTKVEEYRVFFVQESVYKKSVGGNGQDDELFLANLLTPAYYTAVQPGSDDPPAPCGGAAASPTIFTFPLTVDPTKARPSYTDMFGQPIDIEHASYYAFVLAVGKTLTNQPGLPQAAANILSAPSAVFPTPPKNGTNSQAPAEETSA